jgi:DNA-directed RNA polymerase specialized sigma24 family protein
MNTPQQLAEVLTSIRIGNQSFLMTFYEQNRGLFARWARRQHNLEPAAAHELLRTVVVEFYDQVLDGRLTKLPPDLRAYLYGMADEHLKVSGRNTAALPAVEASRRQYLLGLFQQLSTDCQKVLMYFYFRGYNFEKVAGKMGFANSTVARIQKSGCLRQLYELRVRSESTAT